MIALVNRPNGHSYACRCAECIQEQTAREKLLTAMLADKPKLSPEMQTMLQTDTDSITIPSRSRAPG